MSSSTIQDAAAHAHPNTSPALDESITTLHIAKQQRIAAPVQTVWDALLAEMGPDSTMPDGSPFPLRLEPWPGGRYFRDLGDNTGHLWAHVQVIKPPRLLELCGPLFMSYPAVSHVQYRLKEDAQASLLSIVHRAIGLITPEHREGVQMGWAHELERVQRRAERR
ncbi:MAG: SRPBCC domain-containing protein [Phycisphaerales bacterium]